MGYHQHKTVLWLKMAFTATAISVMLVLVISVLIVMTSGSPIDDVACHPVENIEVKESPTDIQVTWDRAIGRDCMEKYQLFITRNDDEVHDGQVDDPRFSIPKEQSCGDYTFIVWSLDSSGKQVAKQIKKHSSGFAGPGDVRNLRIGDNGISWEKPAHSEDCDLRYSVLVTTVGFQPIVDDNVEDTSFEWSPIPCSINDIQVFAVVNIIEWKGDPKSLTHNGPITTLAPIHVRTDPDETGAWVKWIPAEEEKNACEILYIQFSFSETDLEDIDSPKEQDGKYRLDELVANSVYTYKARWLLKGGFGVSSEAVSFRTAPLTSPAQISIRWIGQELRIEWEQDYDDKFITSQEVTIKSLGEQHFVPDDCPDAEDGAFDNVLPGINYWHFDDARSNVKYRVTVTTHFGTLGISRLTSEDLISPMRAPGYLQEITTWHDYEVSVPYEVTSHFRWKIPCDINGPVKHFKVKISGTPQITEATESNCDITFLSVDVAGAEEETYEYYATNLVPFFAYTLHITTVLDHPPETEELRNDDERKFAPLPVAYTPNYSSQDHPAYASL